MKRVLQSQDIAVCWMLLSPSKGIYSAMLAGIFSITGPNGNPTLTLSVSALLSIQITL